MRRTQSMLVLIGLLAGAHGCTMLEPLPGQTPASPPISAHPAVSRAEPKPAIQPATLGSPNSQLARAAYVLERIQVSNAQIPVKAELAVKSIDRPYIAHSGMSRIWISEMLIDRCQSEEQLAGVLALELAKITSERQQRAVELARARENEIPMEVRIGPDAGTSGEADQLHKVEIAKRGLD